MSNIVAKPFKSLVHRFKIEDEITDVHDLRPHTLDDLKARGFVSDQSERVVDYPKITSFSPPRSEFFPKNDEE